MCTPIWRGWSTVAHCCLYVILGRIKKRRTKKEKQSRWLRAGIVGTSSVTLSFQVAGLEIWEWEEDLRNPGKLLCCAGATRAQVDSVWQWDQMWDTGDLRMGFSQWGLPVSRATAGWRVGCGRWPSCWSPSGTETVVNSAADTHTHPRYTSYIVQQHKQRHRNHKAGGDTVFCWQGLKSALLSFTIKNKAIRSH